MSRKFFDENSLLEFRKNNDLYGGKTVTVDKHVLNYIKKLIALDRMAGRSIPNQIHLVNKVYLKETKQCQTSEDYEAANEKALTMFHERMDPLLNLHDFVETLPWQLFNKYTKADIAAKAVMKAAVKYCLSYSEAYYASDLQDRDEVWERFANNVERTGEMIYKQALGREVTFTKWEDDEIERFAEVGTGKTKYTVHRVQRALIKSFGNRYNPEDVLEAIKAGTFGIERMVQIREGEGWETFLWIFGEYPEARQWKIIASSV